MTAPAFLRLVMTVASSSGMLSFNMLEPPVVRIPAVLNWSFTAMGTPCNGPRCWLVAISCSAFRAASKACSPVTVM